MTTDYKTQLKINATKLQTKQQAIILAIETSCDETAAAVVKDGRHVLSNAVHTQIPLHQKYGGVVPELASRSHIERIGQVVDLALSKADITLDQIDGVAVTYGPGLIGALLVGLSYAKGLAYSLNVPLIGVNHILGHIAANYLSFKEFEPPFVCLVASGGHSHILAVETYTTIRLLGKTRDDAAGEAFDKVARVLGLPYPGGPNLEKLAREGNPLAYPFSSSFNASSGLDMSFSGIKTGVINLLHNAEQKKEAVNAADVAASFQHHVVKTLCEKSVAALKQTGYDKLALAGGVSANVALRTAMKEAAHAHGAKFYCPSFEYCTDNAAMIGSAGFYELMAGNTNDLSLNAFARLPLA